MLPKEIRQKRIALNLTQTELAEKFEIKANTIARWERGESVPNARGMLLLAFQSLEIEKGLDNSKIEVLQKKLTEKVERLRVRHSRNKSEWKNINE
ncbi:MAG: helix-turn-helix domain-containing protein [Pyrinomonadaceae bacterium]